MLIDTHAHLNFSELSDTNNVLERANHAGVTTIINIGTNLEDSKTGIEIAEKFETVYTAVGVHPHETSSEIDWEEFEKLAKSPKVVAIGECGLDYSGLQTTDDRLRHMEKDRQRKLFLKQIEISAKYNLPLSIHVRDAYDDLMEIFTALEASGLKGVFHCFSGTPQYLGFILRNLSNFYVSFAGNVTYKNADNIRDLAKLVPKDRLLVETDCPFLSPVPLRGKTNEPANTKLTAQFLSILLNTDFEQLATITTDNAKRLFKI